MTRAVTVLCVHKSKACGCRAAVKSCLSCQSGHDHGCNVHQDGSPGARLAKRSSPPTGQGWILAAGERISSSPFQDGPLLSVCQPRPSTHAPSVPDPVVLDPSLWSGSFQMKCPRQLLASRVSVRWLVVAVTTAPAIHSLSFLVSLCAQHDLALSPRVEGQAISTSVLVTSAPEPVQPAL
ncbi:hypothetical protein BR93DRAFT_330106 [Coniochaeta sp. PMI_546]|nr:hypothetical protein BR93DRAFT_330106 [Coniochaeta sp. PMI_546]